MWYDETKIDALVGEVITEIRGMEVGSDVIDFVTQSGKKFRMYHSQDCCERVYLNDVTGNVSDLIGTPILRASEDTNSSDTFGEIEHTDSFTWTFYNFATIKGYVTLRWLGESNGYYSESVSFSDITNEA